jgi:hypothetical protein
MADLSLPFIALLQTDQDCIGIPEPEKDGARWRGKGGAGLS